MLQNKFEMPLDLVISDSKILKFYFYLIFFLSFVSIFTSSLSLSVQTLLCVVLLASVIFSFKRKYINKITFLHLSKNGKWGIEVNDKIFDAELYGECIVTYFIIWLNFTTCNSFGKKKQFHVLLLTDSSDKSLLRRLRVRLRFLKNETSKSEEVHREIIN